MYTGLELDSILKSFGERTILADVYLKCCRGDIIALFGRNGTGKSTLLNIIFGTLKADRKFIRIDGKVIKGPAFRSGLLAYLPQHPSFPSHLKVSRIAELCIAPEDRKRFFADPILFRIRTSRICEISTGEQRYLEIKTTLFSPAPYILLDEPFSALDFQTRLSVSADIANIIRQTGKTALLITHDLSEAITLADRVIVLSRRPAGVKREMEIHYEISREDPLAVRGTAAYQAYFNQLWEVLTDDKTTA